MADSTNEKKGPAMVPCPKCKHELKRINRRGFDKLLNKIFFVRRYRCLGCLWEGIKVTLHDPDHRAE